MSDKKEKPRKGCLRRLFGFGWGLFKFTVVCCLLAAVGYVIWVNYAGNRAIYEIDKELLSRGIREKTVQPIPTDQNAARFWLAAIELAVDFDHAIYNDITWPKLGERVPSDFAAKLADISQQNQPAFAMVNAAMKFDQNNLGLHTRDDFDRIMYIFGRQRQLSRSLKTKAFYAIAINDSDMAFQACVDSIAVVSVLQNVDLLITHLVQCSIAAMAIETIEHTLSCVEFTPEQLGYLQKQLDSRLEMNLGKAIEGELFYIRDCARDPQWILSGMRKWRIKNPYVFDMSSLYEKYRPWDGVPVPCFNAYEDICAGKEQLTALEEVNSCLATYDLFQKKNVTWQMFKDLEKEITPMNLGTCQVYYQSVIRNAVAQAAMAVETYRMKHGDWPETLELVFDQIPKDAFCQPLKISHDKDGVRIYSVGLDGIDDQGLGKIENSSWQDKDDLTFRLLDPSKRNQEPKPKPEPVTTDDGPANMFE